MKKLSYLIILLLVICIPVNASAAIEFCQKTASIWRIVGWFILIIKILVPVLLIIFGIIDFSKAVISSKPEAVPSAAKSLGFRTIAGFIIFFIPTIVTVAMGLITSFASSDAGEDYKYCRTCIMDPSNCDISKDAGKGK